jgi:NAD-dependent aldehyde dehydrogenases
MGPIANERQYRKVLSVIEQGIADGAKLLIGGTDRPGHCPLGFFVSPTIFSRVSNRMAIAREEIFGPVLVTIPYEDVDEPVAIANDSHFDPSGYIYGFDKAQSAEVAVKLRTGMVHLALSS